MSDIEDVLKRIEERNNLFPFGGITERDGEALIACARSLAELRWWTDTDGGLDAYITIADRADAALEQLKALK